MHLAIISVAVGAIFFINKLIPDILVCRQGNTYFEDQSGTKAEIKKMNSERLYILIADF